MSSRQNPDSKYIATQAANASTAAKKAERLNRVLDWCEKLKAPQLPPLQMMQIIGSHSHEHFVGNMRSIFAEMVRRSGVTKSSNVLDIGCGCGRFALPFSQYLDEGKYYGVDVWKDGVEWCQKNISTKKPSFDFRALEARDNYYFSSARTGARNAFSLRGVPSGAIDFSFAISVFTHLVYEDCVDYFREVSRVLKPGGVFLCTGFLMDRFFWDYRKRTGKHSEVAEKEKGRFYAYASQDFFAGYSMAVWQEMFSSAGLKVEGYELGTWAEKPMASHFQDWFVLMKT